MSDFLGEGGYAFYVWSAYGISALAIAGLVAWTLTAYRKAKRALRELQNSETNI